MKELVGGPAPRMLPNRVEMTRDSLPFQYVELLKRHPFLGRLEGECKTINWTNEEVRTAQLIFACASNVSLENRVLELEAMLGQQTQGKKGIS